MWCNRVIIRHTVGLKPFNHMTFNAMTMGFQNLTKDGVIYELHEPNVKFRCTSSVEDSNAPLKNEFHDMQRLPATMYKNPLDTLESLSL